MAELNFRAASPAQIADAFGAEGCVLLRGCVDPGKLAELDRVLSAILGDSDRVHLQDGEMRRRGLPHFRDYVFDDKHAALLTAILGPRYRISRNTNSRRVAVAGKTSGYQEPLTPHLDAFFFPFTFTVNFWIPFRACGRDAPSLGVVRAPVAAAGAFAGYDGGPPHKGGKEMWNLPNFRNASLTVDDLRDAFGDRVWTPEYELGDAMLLSNWTLHFTHSTPQMTARRGNVELRFSTHASLGERLSDFAPSSALRPVAAMLSRLRRAS